MTTPNPWMDDKKIHFITVHCAGTPRGRNNKAAEVSSWDIARFGEISYHHVIELDGNDVQTLRYNQRGAHVHLENTGNIGICYVGGDENDGKVPPTPADTRTDAQKKALANRLRALKKLYPNAKILGHRDWPNVKRACPSFDVASFLKEIDLC
ncbi:MAG: N-acetylmuramoyl-L-alanine amidase [Zymomonas mobilis]|uniref:N-acetylmuramoyl-L-alanine amidase n=1 Tax=Zymomonas mobilis TaxID=542 RepID=UPI0039E7ED87